MSKTTRYPQPLADRILVKRDDPEAISAGGIVIPDKAQEKTQTGRVLIVGPDVKTLGVGDEIVFLNYGFTQLVIADQPVLVMQEEDVMIVFRSEEVPNERQE